MRRKVSAENPEMYEQKFLVYYLEDDWFKFEKLAGIKDSLASAETEGKKYVHIGPVIIREQLTRVVKNFPKTKACT